MKQKRIILCKTRVLLCPKEVFKEEICLCWSCCYSIYSSSLCNSILGKKVQISLSYLQYFEIMGLKVVDFTTNNIGMVNCHGNCE
jgi:hypothetical protein